MDRSFSSLFFPVKCVSCAGLGSIFCTVCTKEMRRVLPECIVCRRLSPGFKTHKQCQQKTNIDTGFIFWQYNRQVKSLITAYKYKGIKSAGKYLTQCSTKLLPSLKPLSTGTNTLVTSVPLARGKYNMRGFNQVDPISKALAKYLNVSYSPTLIRRFNRSASMAGKSTVERAKFNKGLYYFNKDHLGGLDQLERIILVDDVVSTRSTLEAVTGVIKSQNPSIYVITVGLFRGTAVRNWKLRTAYQTPK